MPVTDFTRPLQVIPKPKFNLAGQRFGTLVALGCVRRERIAYWLCLCDCKRLTLARTKPLRTGIQKHCGYCASRTHGQSSTATYSIWGGLGQRTGNSNRVQYDSYGGRGVTRCQGWRKFENFVADMGERPAPELSVERRDNDGGYWCGHCDECIALGHPSNCYWGTRKEQVRNRRTSRRIEFKDQTKTLAEWCEIYSRDTRLVHARLKSGWGIEEALTLDPSPIPRVRRISQP